MSLLNIYSAKDTLPMRRILKGNTSRHKIYFRLGTLSVCLLLISCSQFSFKNTYADQQKVLSDSQFLLKHYSTADYRCDIEEMTLNNEPEINELMGIKDSWLVKGCDKKLPFKVYVGTGQVYPFAQIPNTMNIIKQSDKTIFMTNFPI